MKHADLLPAVSHIRVFNNIVRVIVIVIVTIIKIVKIIIITTTTITITMMIMIRVEEACLLVYESLNLRRAFLWHFGLAQLTTPPSVLGHNLPQHHPKAVDINLHHSWQAGHAG